MKPKKPIIRTAIGSILIVLTLVVAIIANVMIPPNMNVINAFLGDKTTSIIQYPDGYNDSLDLEYSKLDYAVEDFPVVEKALDEEIMGEGIVLLQNNDNTMPFAAGTTFSFFGRSSTIITPAAFQDKGFGVNEALWNFYNSGAGSGYGLGPGSISFGDAEDFAINECPLDVLQKESGLLSSANGTVPVFVWARIVGEGRDMPRSMYNHTDIPEDQVKSYLEPDSIELAILQYLNDNFDEVVLLVKSSAAMELGWTEEFPNIKSIVFAPSFGDHGVNALADVFAGTINPSGKTVDTFAYHAASAPAAANYGDYQYSDENGEMTKYNYVTYKEGIYVGYKYFETRYEDVILGQGNAGDYDYASTVKYPLGYGLSYTTFEWSNYSVSWNGDRCTVTVDVTNTGDAAGKDVVEVYIQSPYTDYDRQNLVEKASVQLVGFEKTSLLAPGEKETVTVTFDKEQFKAYDYMRAKTYILDAGSYYITAAHDAHDAINNVLAAKGYTMENGMTAEGNADMVDVYTVEAFDSTTFSIQVSTGVTITNQFDFANGGYEYLSRQDWQNTWPTPNGVVSSQISTWGNEINGSDGVPYTYTTTISAEDLAKLDGNDSLSPIDPAIFTDTPVYGANNGAQLIDMRGKEFDDPMWEDILDNITPKQYQEIITTSAYGTAAIDAIGKPFSSDMDSVAGVYMGGTGVVYCGPFVLAQTWNKELASRFGEMAGNTGLVGGTTGWYAPAMNIHRLPFSGRNNEYYSEDGFLSGVMAAATSRGAASKGMYVFIKHFAVNDQENHRGDREGQYSLVTWANEQAIREIYLRPFEMCITNDPITMNYVAKDSNGSYVNTTREIPAVNAIMTAFNRLGYTWTGGCYNLVTNVLRTEWGFNGFVITDAAHTAVFMDAYQMLEAGGDALLTNSKGVRWHYDENDPAQYHYAREALHHILYTVVNSKIMNGYMPGTKSVTPMTLAEKIVIAINVTSVILILALGWFIWRGFRKYKKAKVQQS